MNKKMTKIPQLTLTDTREFDIEEEKRLDTIPRIINLFEALLPFSQRKKRIGLWVMLINECNMCFGVSEVSAMNPSDGSYNVREILQLALVSGAHAISIFQQTRGIEEHLKITELDEQFTSTIFKACTLVGIKINVHYIQNEAGNGWPWIYGLE